MYALPTENGTCQRSLIAHFMALIQLYELLYIFILEQMFSFEIRPRFRFFKIKTELRK